MVGRDVKKKGHSLAKLCLNPNIRSRSFRKDDTSKVGGGKLSLRSSGSHSSHQHWAHRWNMHNNYINIDFLLISHMAAARCEFSLWFMLKLEMHHTSVISIFKWEAQTCTSWMLCKQLDGNVNHKAIFYYPIIINIGDKFKMLSSLKITVETKAFLRMWWGWL